MSDIFRTRHDDASRHARMHGRTARKRIDYDTSLESSVERGADAKFANATFSYLDADSPYGAPGRSQLSEPYKVTAFELDGGRPNLRRERGWETVPSFLTQHSVSVPVLRKLPDGRTETTFELKAKGLIMPDTRVAGVLEHLRTHVYEVRRHKPKLVGIIPSEPPEDIGTMPLLQAALHCTGARVPQTAIVRCAEVNSAWQVAHSNGKPLDIDLGMACRISHFSTQGRHICTRRYPAVWRDYRDGLWRVEDAAYLGAPDLSKSQQYHGPWWTVRSTREHKESSAGFHEPQWVSRYELLWRADNGRKWNSLGVFEGNRDETTEVAHSFAQIRGGGLVARYLRVVPLENHNGGAMRVGVYGEPAARGESRAALRREGSRARGTVCASEDASNSLVEFRVTQPPVGVNRTLTCDGKGASTYRCPCCTGKPVIRRSRRLDMQCALASVSDLADAARDAALELEMDKDEQEAEGRVAHGYAEENELRLACVISSTLAAHKREDVELALALSQSLADQEDAKVARAEDDTATGADEWLHCLSESSASVSEAGEVASEAESDDRGWELVDAE